MIIIQKYLEFYGNLVPALYPNGTATDFTEANATTDSSNLKVKLTGQTGNNGAINVEIRVPLNYLSSFWRTL